MDSTSDALLPLWGEPGEDAVAALLLRVARRADELASKVRLGPVEDLHVWLQAEREVWASFTNWVGLQAQRS